MECNRRAAAATTQKHQIKFAKGILWFYWQKVMRTTATKHCPDWIKAQRHEANRSVIMPGHCAICRLFHANMQIAKRENKQPANAIVCSSQKFIMTAICDGERIMAHTHTFFCGSNQFRFTVKQIQCAKRTSDIVYFLCK